MRDAGRADLITYVEWKLETLIGSPSDRETARKALMRFTNEFRISTRRRLEAEASKIFATRNGKKNIEWRGDSYRWVEADDAPVHAMPTHNCRPERARAIGGARPQKGD